jgi:hypothetical protein
VNAPIFGLQGPILMLAASNLAFKAKISGSEHKILALKAKYWSIQQTSTKVPTQVAKVLQEAMPSWILRMSKPELPGLSLG